jgi:hypothetical protein
VPTRIPASERTSQKLDELLSQGVADGDARAELLKLAVRKIVEEALEAEVAEAVGRDYYENGAAPGAGYRNGYRRGRLRTAEGPIEYGVPQVADRPEPFVSRVRAGLAGRTAELERLAVEMYARGLSTRDVEAAFRDATGGSLLSRTAVSQITERLLRVSPLSDGVAVRHRDGMRRVCGSTGSDVRAGVHPVVRSLGRRGACGRCRTSPSDAHTSHRPGSAPGG